SLPAYLHNAQARLEALWAPIRSMSGKVTKSVLEFAATAENPATSASAPSASAPSAAAPPVTSNARFVATALQTVLPPVAFLAGVVVMAGAMLVQGGDLRDRLVRLVGDTQVPLTTKAL